MLFGGTGIPYLSDITSKVKENAVIAYQYSYTGNMSDTLSEIRKGLDEYSLILTEAIKSNKPSLSITIKVAKKMIIVDEEQEFTVTVTNSVTGEKILGAYINYRLISPTGSRYEFNAGGLTDEKGNFSTKHDINQVYETGITKEIKHIPVGIKTKQPHSCLESRVYYDSQNPKFFNAIVMAKMSSYL